MKHRLIGAVVLISLAVIFVPMLLDVNDESGQVIRGTNIPPEPEYEFSPLNVPNKPAVATADEKTEQSDVTFVDEHTPEMNEPAKKSADGQPEATEPEKTDDEQTADHGEDTSETTGQAETAKTSAETAKTPPEKEIKIDSVKPAPQVPPPATGRAVQKEPNKAIPAWAVQVGSFTQRANALKLRDKIRSGGYASYVEVVKTDKGLIYRVRVGPELNKSAAETLQQQLAKDMKVRGFVVSH
jgi:DedD protein